jgi:hypothetical protein
MKKLNQMTPASNTARRQENKEGLAVISIAVLDSFAHAAVKKC